MTSKGCKTVGCLGPHAVKGYCPTCYYREVVYTKRCPFAGCPRRSRGSSFCPQHNPTNPTGLGRKVSFPLYVEVTYRRQMAMVRGQLPPNHTGGNLRQVGQAIETREAFHQRFDNNPGIRELWENWRRSGFQTQLAPTCFRRDPYGPFLFWNLTWDTKANAAVFLNLNQTIGGQNEGTI